MTEVSHSETKTKSIDLLLESYSASGMAGPMIREILLPREKEEIALTSGIQVQRRAWNRRGGVLENDCGNSVTTHWLQHVEL